MRRCCGVFSSESSCYSIGELYCLPDAVGAFFPFLTLAEAVTGNSLDEISQTKLVETFDLGFLLAVEELAQYFMLASLGWTLAIVPLFAVLYFALKHLISIRFSPKYE